MSSLKSLIVAALALFVIGFTLLILASQLRAEEYTAVLFDRMTIGELEQKSFETSQPITIHINAIGAGRRESDDLYAYGWILNNNTREPEWIMDYDNTTSVQRKSNIREFDGDVRLDRGSFTAFFYPGNPFSAGVNISLEDFGDVFTIIGDALSDHDEVTDEFKIEITTDSQAFSVIGRPSQSDDRMVLQLLATDDDYYESEGMTLTKQVPLRIYAVGEYSRGDKTMVDYAWIVDADSREKVWMMERWNTELAGGARKNRMSDEVVTLPAGDYIVYCSTDDSHSPAEWNMAPPYDPYGWGVTIFVEDPNDASSVKPYSDEQSSREILSITRVGNSEYEARYFTLKKPAELHIYAIGEYDNYGDDFADYAWIENRKSFERVWEMGDRNTEHAGGASKNRKFVGNVKFAPGDYVVYYVTDDSHAYRDWNSSPPADQRNYGITIYGVGSGFDKSIVEVTDRPAKDGNALASITAVGSDEEESQSFTLDRRTKVRIYAVGEGVKNEMYDYAWIEDSETGRIVWEMTYRRTEHAGGANKNRMVNDVIELDKGAYEVYYITDDSHAFGDWNSSKPDDQTHWGVTITIVN
ncbi:MAG: hypothetical protein ABIK83_09570 [Candidatus Zixiibacteriota bacterium]